MHSPPHPFDSLYTTGGAADVDYQVHRYAADAVYQVAATTTTTPVPVRYVSHELYRIEG